MVNPARLGGPAASVVLALAGAGLGLLASSRPWAHARVHDAVLGATTVTASGRQAAPVVAAVCLVALAGAVALLLARAIGRRLVGLVLVLAGAACAAASVALMRSPAAGVSDLVGRAVGTVGGAPADITVTWWPWVAVASGGLMIASGALTVLRAGRWASARARFDPPSAQTPRAGADGQEDPGVTWDALSRGEDPTR